MWERKRERKRERERSIRGNMNINMNEGGRLRCDQYQITHIKSHHVSLLTVIHHSLSRLTHFSFSSFFFSFFFFFFSSSSSDYANSSCLSIANTIIYIVLDTCISGLSTITSISGKEQFVFNM